MTERCRFVLTEDGRLDLSAYRWDDHRFTDLMTRAGTATTDTAMSISRHLRKEIDKIEERTITMSVIEKIIDENPYKTPMLIYPATHYTMGGVWDYYNLMTTVPSLYCIQEDKSPMIVFLTI